MNEDNMTNQRILREVTQLLSEQDGITQATGGRLRIVQNSNFPECFQAVLQGPEGSPFSEGVFTLHVEIPKRYPFQAPVIHFETPIYHPNVSFESGKVALDCLINNWNPAWTLHKLLLALYSLLEDPILDDTFTNNEAAKYIWMGNHDGYKAKAQEMTKAYAAAKTPLQFLSDIGFTEEDADTAIARCERNMSLKEDHGLPVLERFERNEAPALENLQEQATPTPPKHKIRDAIICITKLFVFTSRKSMAQGKSIVGGK